MKCHWFLVGFGSDTAACINADGEVEEVYAGLWVFCVPDEAVAFGSKVVHLLS